MVVLIYPNNSPYLYHKVTPLSILCLGSYLEERGIEVEYFDERIHPRSRLKELVAQKPEMIGISSMTSYQIRAALRLAKMIRNHDDSIPLVWGGVHPTMFIEQTLQNPYVDYIIRNEGEESLYEFIKFRRGQTKLKIHELKGLCWIDEDGKVVINAERPFVDVNTLPFPYIGKAEPILREYIADSHSIPTVNMQLSRGCPYSCAFCYNVFYSKRKMRVKDMDKIERELTILKRDYGVERIVICDDSIVSGHKRKIRELCEITGRIDLAWEGDCPVNYINDEMVETLKKGRCEYLFFGIESGNPDILKKFSKGADVAANNRAIECMSKSGLDTTYSLIIGHPWETEEVLEEQLNYADWIHKTHPNAEIAIQPYLPLPGTTMYDYAVKLGFNAPKKMEKWAEHTHDEYVRIPWIKNKRRLQAIYLLSFFAFRFDRFLKHATFRHLYTLLHKFSLWRWKHRYFDFYFEAWLFKAYKEFGKLLVILERRKRSFVALRRKRSFADDTAPKEQPKLTLYKSAE